MHLTEETMSYLRGNRADLVVHTVVDGEEKEFFNEKRTELLIKMLPEGFFIDMATRIGIIFFVMLIIMIGICVFVIRKTNKSFKIY